MAANRMAVDAGPGIPELVHRLRDDSKRLVVDEVRLAKLEVREDLRSGGKDLTWLVASFGVAVVGLIALTLFFITLIGRILNGHMWVGALVIGVAELGLGITLMKRGVAVFKEQVIS